jgi:DNA polymerase II small subunit
MDTRKILDFCIKNGLLLDKEVLNLFSETNDFESVKLIIEKIKNNTGRKIITKDILNEDGQLKRMFSELPKENQEKLEKLKIKLGLSIEISRETGTRSEDNPEFEIVNERAGNVKVLSIIPILNGKPEVGNFVKYFRNRFSEIRNIIQSNPKLTNLISINKLSKNRQGISIIGIVSDKKITKNKNILLEVEDLTGKVRVLISSNKPEVYKEAEEITLDSVIGFRGAGDREIIFVNDMIFPEARVLERKKSPLEEYSVFIGDLHFGSRLFLKENFLKFIDYLNGKFPNTPEASKIKYLFIAGDVVSGIGNYPTQEKDLEITDLEEQFVSLADLFGKIRKDITIIISPGNHDGVRLMEPQPLFDEKYAWPLYDLKNVVLTGNPAYVNIGSGRNFSGFDVLTYHGFSYPFYADNIPSLITNKAMHSPDLIMKYLLKNRHLAPTHTSVQYFPFDEDYLVIKRIPDIFVSAHTHKSAISYYNNILVISVSSWESISPYEEKMGADPDFCKVPMFNLKTREVKVLDFE